MANAVLDGVDAMLLGAETLRGKYPLDTVRAVLSIARQAELVFDYEAHYDHMIDRRHGGARASGHGHACIPSSPDPPGRVAENALVGMQTAEEGSAPAMRRALSSPAWMHSTRTLSFITKYKCYLRRQ